ncbi:MULTISPECIES: GNAT family N-acetyltransferase [unclassified Exiguobacterium]|uniref:lipid II:glycine glycyltransferase FemX n=1 Tax=unclassified Exiguobacterium TaxID=2644629 RepID=UPI00137588F7|nr:MULTISPECIES: GNAT family N-acetyltransferase [unclassified Exiguobacterium]
MFNQIVKNRWEWENWLREVSCDSYDHYDYVLANCEPGEQPELYIAAKEDGILLYPYIRRPIAHRHDDLVTAYGYGGPFREGNFSNEDVAEARRLFLKRPENQATVTETIRYHPCRVDKDLMRVFGHAVPIRQTVHVRLDESFEQLEQRFSKMTKRNVKRAIREQVKVVRGQADQLCEFIRLYRMTMDRRAANGVYYFSDRYFEDLWNSETCETELLFAVHKGIIVAGVFMLYGDDGAHYHLGGSDANYLALRPNHFLFREMIRRGGEKEKAYVHLGGGATGEDALYDFKQSFSGDEPLTYYIGQAVLNEAMYQRLNQDHLLRYGPSDFFPLYRTPGAETVAKVQAKR